MSTSAASRVRTSLPTIALAAVLAGCGAGGLGGGPPSDDAATLYVDVLNGHDGNPGTSSAPFRSITHALQLARTAPLRGEGDVIRVSPGLYHDAFETFPLVVPSGVVIERDPSQGMPEILGGGAMPPQYGSGFTAAVVLEERALLRGFEITNALTVADPGFHYGLILVGDDAVVDGCSLTRSQDGGIRVTAGSYIEIRGTDMTDHADGVGLFFAGGGLGGVVKACDITGNRVGVEFDALGAALNGTDDTEARVQIFGNSHTDLWVAPGIYVDARGCNWDQVPPILWTNNIGAGLDIFHQDGPSGIDVSLPGPATN